MIHRHSVPWIGVEAAGIGLAVVQSLRRRGIAVRMLRAAGNKQIRSQSAQIRMEASTVYFPVGRPWVEALETELTLFPGSGARRSGGCAELRGPSGRSAQAVRCDSLLPLSVNRERGGGEGDPE